MYAVFHTYSRWVLSQFAMALQSPLTIEYKPGLPKSLFQSGQQGESQSQIIEKKDKPDYNNVA